VKVGDLVRDRHEHSLGIVVSFPEPRPRHRPPKARPCVEIYHLNGETAIYVFDPFDPVWEVISESR
jgi:hypothetical protein